MNYYMRHYRKFIEIICKLKMAEQKKKTNRKMQMEV